MSDVLDMLKRLEAKVASLVKASEDRIARSAQLDERFDRIERKIQYGNDLIATIRRVAQAFERLGTNWDHKAEIQIQAQMLAAVLVEAVKTFDSRVAAEQTAEPAATKSPPDTIA